MASRTIRRVALIISALLLLAACGNGEDVTEEPEATPAEAPADEPEPEPSDEPEAEPDDDSTRANYYYGGSELIVPEHDVDGYSVDFFASFDSVADISAWFSRNIDDFDQFTVEEETVNGEARWVAHRDDAEAGSVARIEIANSSAHGDMGLITSIADVLPPDVMVIAVAFAV